MLGLGIDEAFFRSDVDISDALAVFHLRCIPLDNGRWALTVADPPVTIGTLLLDTVVGGVGTSSGTEGVAELTSFVLRGHASHRGSQASLFECIEQIAGTRKEFGKHPAVRVETKQVQLLKSSPPSRRTCPSRGHLSLLPHSQVSAFLTVSFLSQCSGT
jgi:hypothetical protein